MESHTISSSLLRSVLFERFRWRALILFTSAFAAILGLLAPYAQKQFVDGLVLADSAWFWVIAAFSLTLSAQFLAQGALWLASREAVISQKALSDEAYKKMLEGPGALVGKAPAGEAVSFFAVEIPGATGLLDQALIMASSMLFPILLAPAALHLLFGIPWWASAPVILALGTLNFFLARRQSRFFYKYKQMAAERTGLVSEWINNIRTLRILGWVEAAEERIFSLRRKETRNRKSMVTNGQLMNSIATSSTFLLNILAVLFLLRLKGPGADPTPGELLALLWILGVFLARPLRQLPWTFVIGLDALSSIRRLERAFSLQVEKPLVEGWGATQEDPGLGLGGTAALEIRGLQLESGGKELLSNIDLVLKEGELVAVVGEVGSGKTLLLQSIIGNTGARFLRFRVGGKDTAGPLDPAVRGIMAFVSQEGFVMSATLRENVSFRYFDGNETDPETDEQALTSLGAAQFVPDEENVSEGLFTEIGERGVNLSGGQRQRVSLARARFSRRKIVLLDDCLSAVDVETEKRLIESLILGDWKDCTRLLATHRMSVLPYCDRVLFLENGAVAMQGTFENLLKSRKFADFVQKAQQQDEKKGEQDA